MVKNLLDEKDYYDGVVNSYKQKPTDINENLKVKYDSPTFDVYINEKQKIILITIRGTKTTSMGDLYADYKLAFNNLKASNRFKGDVDKMKAIIRKYNPNEYLYYITGHSLGGAIVNEFMRRFPFIKYATTFNSASQPQDIKQQNNEKVKRIYVDKDFLYRFNSGYKYDRLKVLKYEPEKVKGFFDWIKNRMNPTPTMFKSHSLDQPVFKKMYGLAEGDPKILRDDYIQGGCGKKVCECKYKQIISKIINLK